MSFCLGKRFSLGTGKMAPKPQDACALPRKKNHGPAQEIGTALPPAQSQPHRKRTGEHQATRARGRHAAGSFRARRFCSIRDVQLGSAREPDGQSQIGSIYGQLVAARE